MQSLIIKRRHFDLRFTGVLSLTILIIMALILQLQVSATNTFPNQYELVSTTADGQGLQGGTAGTLPVSGVSEDGSKILFSSSSQNLPNASPTASWGGYLRDMSSPLPVRIDVTPSGAAPNQLGSEFVMNTTGRYIAFASSASDIVTTPSTSTYIKRIYIKDMQANTTELAVNPPGPSVSGDSSLKPFSISDDGRYLIFQTLNINKIIPGTRSGSPVIADVVLLDRTNQSWTILNKTPTGGLPSTHTNGTTSSSCDSSLSFFMSDATDLVNNHSGSGYHLYLVDIRNGVSITDITPGAIGNSSGPAISCNGRYITYSTSDRTLIPTPSGMNSTSSQAVRYDRFTGERKYIGSQSNNTTYNSYGSSSASVSDKGDSLITLFGNHIFYDYKVYFKHLSDGSGTLEKVQNNPAGLNAYNNTYRISSDGKYVVTATQDAYLLGLPVQNVSGSDIPRNVIRIKTGL